MLLFYDNLHHKLHFSTSYSVWRVSHLCILRALILFLRIFSFIQIFYNQTKKCDKKVIGINLYFDTFLCYLCFPTVFFINFKVGESFVW